MAGAIVAMQMYTLRNEAAANYPDTLKKVAAIGYSAVQVSGLHTCTAQDISKAMKDLGLASAGTHIGFDLLKNEFNKAVDIVKTLNTPYAIVPSAPKEVRDSADGWKKFAAEMNDIAVKLKTAGLILGYHNHAFEFARVGRETGYDILMKNLKPEVQPEIDTYWVKHGGGDPAALIKKYKGRIDVVHFKDMGKGEDKQMVPVGNGILDWPGIITACKAGGAKFLCIEQDNCEPLAPLDAAKVSFDNCRKWGLA